MPIFDQASMPPAGKKVRWTVQVPGHVVWTIDVDALTPEEAIAVANHKVSEDTDMQPDESPEPEYSDTDILEWSEIPEQPVGHDGQP